VTSAVGETNSGDAGPAPEPPTEHEFGPEDRCVGTARHCLIAIARLLARQSARQMFDRTDPRRGKL